jgi:hypothetical protein
MRASEGKGNDNGGRRFQNACKLRVEHQANCYTIYGHLSSNGEIEKQERIITSAGTEQYFEKCP